MATFGEAPPGYVEAGEKIFETKCAQCHPVEKGAGHKQDTLSKHQKLGTITTNTDHLRICICGPYGRCNGQWALSRTNLPSEEAKPTLNEESLRKQQASFSKVARLLKLPEEENSRSILQVLFDCTCKRMIA